MTSIANCLSVGRFPRVMISNARFEFVHMWTGICFPNMRDKSAEITVTQSKAPVSAYNSAPSIELATRRDFRLE